MHDIPRYILSGLGMSAAVSDTIGVKAATTASTTVSPTAGSNALAACSASMNGVLPSSTPAGYVFSGNVRKYYIAAEEVEWNYAPSGWDNWLGVPLDKSPRAQYLLQYGTTWLKALYRGYTDSTFTEYSPQPPWQGTQGPTLRSEVGDMIEIMFVNKLSKNYATMHSMGLAYTKASEGSDYANNTAAGQNVVIPETGAVPPVDAGVAPGGCVVYKWMVDSLAGPTFGAPSATHSYHSYVAMQQDTNAGLIGPSIVYAAGQMNATMSQYREFPLLYMVYNEMDSWLSGENKAKLGGSSTSPSSGGQGGQNNYNGGQGGQGGSAFGGSGISGVDANAVLSSGNQTVWKPQLVNLAGSGAFPGAPSFFTINGYVFANNPTYEMCLNDKVIWYVNAYGSASHVFHMHGNGVTYNGAHYPAIGLNDGVGRNLLMNATGAGQWQVICHVNNHHTMGMLNNYQVHFAGQCPLEPLA